MKKIELRYSNSIEIERWILEAIKSNNWDKFSKKISEIDFNNSDAIYIYLDVFKYIDRHCSDKISKQMSYKKIGEQVLLLQENMLTKIDHDNKLSENQQIDQLQCSFYLLVNILDKLLTFIKSPWSRNIDYSLLIDSYNFIVGGHTLVLERYQKLYWSISINLWKVFFSQYETTNKDGKNRFMFTDTSFLNQLRDTSQIDELTSTCNLLYRSN